MDFNGYNNEETEQSPGYIIYESLQEVSIFSLIEDFYLEHDEFDDVIPQKVLEKYFRLLIWDGRSNDEIHNMWPVMELTFLYMEERELEDPSQLNMYDYQLMLWRAAHGELGKNVYLLTEDNVKYFINTLGDFYEYLLNRTEIGDEMLEISLEDFHNSVYVLNNFDFPEINENDEFFEQLLHISEMTQEEALDMNSALEQLLNKMGDFYQKPEYELDLNRAMMLFTDPDMPEDEKTNREFWYSFWDYFMFDYHLITSDMVPVYYYFKTVGPNLAACEKMIIRDLINAQFRVFEIVTAGDTFAYCKDLLRDEYFEIPTPNIVGDTDNVIMLGHTHKSGPMLLNYLTQFEATPKLRERIVNDIMQQFKMYRCQAPKASMDDFLNRHSALVRQIIMIFSTRAQLGVTSFNDLPKPMKKRKRNFVSKELKKQIIQLWQKVGMSKSCIRLAWDLYTDAVMAECNGPWIAASDEVICAVTILICRINNMVYVKQDGWFKIFNVKKNDVTIIVDWIIEGLDLRPSDPRYMSEEGFVRALYFEPTALGEA
ncbi:MAG: hypothetical protein MSA77_02945 [Selenomonadales bacterium]|nr:hypothetical protein [Selenomonadales bacterium]